MAYKRKSDEQKQAEWKAIRENVKITDLASEYGLTIHRKGRYYSLKEHDSVMINAERNIFIRNSRPEAAGSCIDFAMEFGHYDNIHEILTDFSKRISGNDLLSKTNKTPVNNVVKEKKEITLPPRDGNVKNVFAYLTSTRKIDKSIVSEFIADRRLYQDTHKNCVFVSRNNSGEVVYAGLRGTNTYRRFVGDVEGCDYSRCFYVDNGGKDMVVTESVIDGMSHMTFDRFQGFSDKSKNYLALASANKYEAVATHLMEHPEIQNIYLAFDNDESGRMFAEKTKELLDQINWQGNVIDDFPKLGKDWNEQLCRCAEQKIRYDFYLPYEQTKQVMSDYCSSKYECFVNRADARAYTKSKKQRDEIMKVLIDDESFPETLFDYMDMYYQNTRYLQECEHIPENAVDDILEHYNRKNKDFSDLGKKNSDRQNQKIERMRQSRVMGIGINMNPEFGIGD